MRRLMDLPLDDILIYRMKELTIKLESERKIW